MSRILLIDDDPEVVSLVTTTLGEADPMLEIENASNVDKARELIRSGFFDLAICDLKLPIGEGGVPVDGAGEHVFQAIRELAPGLPVLFLSAYMTFDFAQLIVNKHAEKLDLYGDRKPVALYECHPKDRLQDALNSVRETIRKIDNLKAIEVSGVDAPVDLGPKEKRVLRIFARRMEGAVVRVRPLGGGLSGATTLEVQVRDASGHQCALAFAKLDELGSLKRELEMYDKYVAPLGGIASYAPRTGVVGGGAHDLGGIFYTIAADYRESLFDVLACSDQRASRVVGHLRAAQENWLMYSRVDTVTVASIRKLFVSNRTIESAADRLRGLPQTAVEALKIQLKQCPQHRDHHGLNVLVRDSDESLLIDYGDVERGPSCTDPLFLEFSLFLHPRGQTLVGEWPSLHALGSWWALDEFLVDCPFPGFVRACRAWAFEVAEGEKMLLATAYALGLRALRFGGARQDAGITLAAASAKRLLELAR